MNNARKGSGLLKTVLVIDDDLDTLAFMNKILTNAGYEFLQAVSVKESQITIQNFAPHLILVDYKLGEENGFEILNYLKSVNSMRLIPVVMMSSTVNKKLVLQALSSGALEFIGKPLKAATIVQKVKKILKQHELPTIIFKESPKVLAKCIAETIKINEMNVLLQSSVKFDTKTPLKIDSAFFNNLGANNCRFNTEGEPFVANPGVYRTKVNFKGMNENTARKIRNIKVQT